MEKRRWRIAGPHACGDRCACGGGGGGHSYISAANRISHPTQWILDEGMDRSVEHHSAVIVPPRSFRDEQLRHGFIHFDEMCVWCHCDHGVELGKGLQPRPHDLKKQYQS